MGNRNLKVNLILIFLIIFICGTIQAETITEDNSPLQPENLMLLEVHLDNLTLQEEYLASYSSNGVTLIPIGQLTSILELSFVVNPEKGTIEGFIRDESEEYFLDAYSQIAKVDGSQFEINGHRVAINETDIYLDIDLIEKWMPFQIDLNPYRSIIRIITDKPLPVQEKMERRFRWETLEKKDMKTGKVFYPAVENPYELISGPFVDHNLYFSYQKEGDSSLRHITRLSGDFLYMNGRLIISGPIDDPLSEINTKIGRRSPDFNLLGLLKAHEFWLGDLRQPAVNNITGAQSVQGFFISSFPYTISSEFFSHTFEGELLEGWEVELYKDEVLIDYYRSNEQEKYVFENVPINYGLNEFTLVFYDQFGKKYKETKRYRVDSSLITPGDNLYRIDYGWDSEDAQHAVFKYGRGINESLSFLADYLVVPLDNESEEFARLGLRGSIGGLFWEADYLKAINGGQAGQVGFYTTLANTHISFNQALFDDYRSPAISEIKNRSVLDLRRSFNLPVLSDLGVRLNLQREVSVNNEVTTDIYNYISTGYKGYYFSNTLNYKAGEHSYGSFKVMKRINDYRFIGELEYHINPYQSSMIIVELYKKLDEVHDIKAQISRSLITDKNTYTAKINREMDNYMLGLNADYDSDGDWSIGLNFSTSFGYDDKNKEFKFIDSSNYGAVHINTYLEKNGKKVGIENVGYKINGKTFSHRTDEQGHVSISNLKSDAKTNIAIDSATLNDPYLIVKKEGVSFIPRAGQIFELDLPVVMTGELGGYVYLQKEDETVGIGNIEVQLLDQDGEVIKNTMTAYDGFFYMMNLRPGVYKLHISPEYLKNRGLTIIKENKEVEITDQGGYVDGFNFILKRAG